MQDERNYAWAVEHLNMWETIHYMVDMAKLTKNAEKFKAQGSKHWSESIQSYTKSFCNVRSSAKGPDDEINAKDEFKTERATNMWIAFVWINSEGQNTFGEYVTDKIVLSWAGRPRTERTTGYVLG